MYEISLNIFSLLFFPKVADSATGDNEIRTSGLERESANHYTMKF